MAYRKKVRNISLDRRIFSNTKDRTHKYNVFSRPKRGGFRL